MDSEYVLELTDAQFDDAIAQHELILIDFWAPWCGPCLRLAPTLVELGRRYKDKAVIAKLNISDNEHMSVQYAIKTIPTLLLFHKAKVVDQVGGVVPIANLEALLDKYLV